MRILDQGGTGLGAWSLPDLLIGQWRVAVDDQEVVPQSERLMGGL